MYDSSLSNDTMNVIIFYKLYYTNPSYPRISYIGLRLLSGPYTDPLSC